jgi:hypothetical protein
MMLLNNRLLARSQSILPRAVLGSAHYSHFELFVVYLRVCASRHALLIVIICAQVRRPLFSVHPLIQARVHGENK